MSARRHRDERGNMLPLAIASLFVLFAVLAFAIDQGIAYAAKARQENVLDAARSACMDASFALTAKNSQDPGRAVAEAVVGTAREEGFAGCVTVWFYEEPAEGLSLSERLWAVGMQMEEEAPTVFSRGYGLSSLPVASHRVVVAEPYASERAWRPDERACGRYEAAAGAGAAGISFVRMDKLDEFPAEMADSVRAALSEG